jgi:hypothetical protein
MTITQAKAVYDRNHIDKDNIANKDFALERDQARYELFAAELPPRDICDFEYYFYGKTRNLSDIMHSIRRQLERMRGGDHE